MNEDEIIGGYIRQYRYQYTREALTSELEKQGHSLENINRAWEEIIREDRVIRSRNSPIRSWYFWITLLLFTAGVPFISGLVARLLYRGNASDQRAFSEAAFFSPFSVGLLVILVTIIAVVVLSVRNPTPRKRHIAYGLVTGIALVLLLSFVPPFIILGICTVGYNLGH